MKHAPPGYRCPFCVIAATLPGSAPEDAVVLIEKNVFALVPTNYYGDLRGNCIVVPRAHYENRPPTPPKSGWRPPGDCARLSTETQVSVPGALLVHAGASTAS